jgi:hypothetical protein
MSNLLPLALKLDPLLLDDTPLFLEVPHGL